MKTRIPLIAAFLLVAQASLPLAVQAATITVTSTADSGAGSLRAALARAANGDTIDASGVAGTILLTSGELLVSNNLTILGPGPAYLAVNGNAASRVFYIGSNTVVSISSLTITNGSASSELGGGIYNDHATLTVSNCTLSGNSGFVGGIYNGGESGSATLTVVNSTLSSNSATAGGGIYNDGAFGSATLTIVNSTLSGNSASGGGGIYNDGPYGTATLTVSNSTLSGNSATADDGGGIYNYDYVGTATLTIVNSTLSSNSSTAGGGGIYNDGGYGSTTLTVSNSTLRGNSAARDGGGIYNDGAYGTATLTIVNSTLSSNSASGGGGGIFNYDESYYGESGSATLTISNSTLRGNSADGGGGIWNYGYEGSVTLTIVNSTLSGNSSTAGGGGIWNYEYEGTAPLTIVNSTLSSNSATNGGGGIFNYGYEGTATLTVSNSTLSGNSATVGGGIDNLGDYSVGGAALTIVNSTLSGNSATNGGGCILFEERYGIATLEIGSTILNAGASGGNISNDNGTVTSLGYNLSSDGGGGFLTATGDQINTDPKLGPLQDNGGPTFTQALLPGSPAIDKGKNFSGSATDQRGQPRVFDDPDIPNASGGDGTDIGAYEAINLRITAMQKAGNDLHLSFTSGAGGQYVVESRSNLLTGAWAPLPGTNTGTGVIVQLVETNALAVSQQFYRIHQLP